MEDYNTLENKVNKTRYRKNLMNEPIIEISKSDKIINKMTSGKVPTDDITKIRCADCKKEIKEGESLFDHIRTECPGCLHWEFPLDAKGGRRKTRKKRGGEPLHPLTVQASNEIKEFYKYPSGTPGLRFVPQAHTQTESKSFRENLSYRLFSKEIPERKDNFTEEDKRKYDEIKDNMITAYLGNIDRPWNTQSGEGGGRRRKTRKKRGGDINQCYICFKENLQEDNDHIRLSCGHIFCRNCISPWLNRANTCPNCRAVINEEDQDRILSTGTFYSDIEMDSDSNSGHEEIICYNIVSCGNSYDGSTQDALDVGWYGGENDEWYCPGCRQDWTCIECNQVITPQEQGRGEFSHVPNDTGGTDLYCEACAGENAYLSDLEDGSQSGGKRRKKKTRRKKGGFLNWFVQRDSDTNKFNLVVSNKSKRKSIYGEPHPLRKYIVDPRDNDDFDEDRTDGFSISFPFFGGRKKKTRKKQFLYNPNDPSKSFDVYIDKNPNDTIPIKYTTVKDVKDTIIKLERLYKTKKYPHKRIWQVGMIMKVRLEAMKKHKKTRYPNAKGVTSRFNLANKYFKFLGKRSKKHSFDERKNMVFKF